ncbi:MAG: ASCH/PUA domain-containing protein [Janthinobacterium lividum]
MSTVTTARYRTHELQLWTTCFAAVAAGTKPFDVRENDCDFQVGDALLIREYDPDSQTYSGQTLLRWVSHLLPGGSFGVEDGWCVLGLGNLAPLPPGITDTRLW